MTDTKASKRPCGLPILSWCSLIRRNFFYTWECWRLCMTEAVKWKRMRWDYEILYLNALNVVWDYGDEDKENEECGRHGQTSRFQSHFPHTFCSVRDTYKIRPSSQLPSFISQSSLLLRLSPKHLSLPRQKNTTTAFYGSLTKITNVELTFPRTSRSTTLQSYNIAIANKVNTFLD